MIKLTPVFQEKIWGGQKLREVFDYKIPSNKTGECWAISAHPNGDCLIETGEFKGQTLSSLYQSRRDLFGSITDKEFPLLIKILDAKDKLSVQVHPDDSYAREVEGVEFGKTECWYILDCDEDAELILGHHAKSKEEMSQLIEANQWNDLLRTIKIQPGEFYYIPSGTLHAIKENTLILEIQQSSDTTYRVYDYDRLQDGKPRELHIDQSIEVTTVPHSDYHIDQNVERNTNYCLKTLVEEKYFTVSKLNVLKKAQLHFDKPFLLVDVIKGDGYLNGDKITKGEHFILTTSETAFEVEGNVELFISSI